MLRSRVLLLPVTVATAVAVALTGCSSSSTGSGQPAGQASSGSSAAASSSAASKPTDAAAFVTDAIDAFEQAPAAHVSGKGEDNGQPIAFDLTYGTDVALGKITLEGNQIEVSQVADGTIYFKAGAAFWESAGVPADGVATLADKYVQVTDSTQGLSDIVKLLDRTQFAESFRPSSSDLEGAEVSGPTDVNGVSCYGVVDAGGASEGAFYAMAGDTPYPVQLTAGSEGTFDFDGYDATVTVPTPDPSQVVQLPAS